MNERGIWGTLHPFYEAGEIMGRTEANKSFFQALLRLDPFDEYHFFLPTRMAVLQLKEYLEAAYPEFSKSGRLKLQTRRGLAQDLRSRAYRCFHLSDCISDFVPLAALRNAASKYLFPVTGTTHSLSYHRYMPHYLSHIWPGCSGRDCITATAGSAAGMLRATFSRLRQGYGLAADQFPQPDIRVIPLGVDPAMFPAPEDKKSLGEATRQKYELGNGTLTLLFARLAHYSKLDPIPVLKAFKQSCLLAPDSPQELVIAGYAAPEDNMPETLQKLARNLGISLKIIASPSDEERRGLFAAADIFISPADNLQETFGLTLLEAAVSGLPAVVSDFDGYRDLVEHGATGFLAPTCGPAGTPMLDAQAPLLFDSQTHMRLAQQCVVDVPKMAEYLARLARNPDLRQSMGRAARARALAGFTWEAVARRHVELWDELAGRPLGYEEEARLRKAVHPMGMNFMDSFGHYFSLTLGAAQAGERLVQWTVSGQAIVQGRDFPVMYSDVAPHVSVDRLKELLFAARQPISLGSLGERFRNASDSAGPDFLLLWALKNDYLAFSPE